MAAQPKGGLQGAGNQAKNAAGPQKPAGDDSSSDGSGSSEEDEDEDEAAPGGDGAAKGGAANKSAVATAAAPLPGAYNPNDFKHLPVSSEV